MVNHLHFDSLDLFFHEAYFLNWEDLSSFVKCHSFADEDKLLNTFLISFFPGNLPILIKTYNRSDLINLSLSIIPLEHGLQNLWP